LNDAPATLKKPLRGREDVDGGQRHTCRCGRLPAVVSRDLNSNRLMAIPVLKRTAPYALTLAAVALAVFVRWLTAPWLEGDMRYGLLYAAVAFASWIGGWRPGAVAAVGGFLATEWMLRLTDAPPARGDLLLALLLCAGSCGVIIYLVDAHGTALEDASRRADELARAMRERDQAAIRFRKAEALFRQSHEASTQGYAVLSALRDHSDVVCDFVFEYVNPVGAAMVGASPKDLVGRPLTDAVLDSAANLLPHFLEVLNTGTAADFEADYRHGVVEARFRHLVVKAGGGVAVTFVDVARHVAARGDARLQSVPSPRATD
jgi:PAS domain-containing protein